MSDQPEDRVGERIAKLLARAGVASRREIERMIAEGRVRLNDVPVTTPATVLVDLKGITVDGRPVAAAEAARLFVFHKPAGLLTAERDPAGRPTIYTALRNALPPETPRVMPVGRLDLNTEGLLLLTNDGELKRKLELPATGIPRTYRVRTYGDISQARLEELAEGIEIEGVRYGSINANMERRTGRNQWIEMTLTEGKNREIRRVLEHLGLEVSRLLRTSYGPFELADLPRGAAGEIAPVQVERFRVELGLPPSLAATERPPARLAVRAAPARNAPTRRPPTSGSSAAAAKVRPARSGGGRRKPDPARPDEATGRRTGTADRSGPRERAAPGGGTAGRERTERRPDRSLDRRPERRPERKTDERPAPRERGERLEHRSEVRLSARDGAAPRDRLERRPERADNRGNSTRPERDGAAKPAPRGRGSAPRSGPGGGQTRSPGKPGAGNPRSGHPGSGKPPRGPRR